MNLWIFLRYENVPKYALKFTTAEIYRNGWPASFPNDKFLGLYPATFIRDCLTHSLFYFSLSFRRSVGSLPFLRRRASPETQYFVALTLE